MALSLSFPEEDLSCPVCVDIFKDPVILSCSHSFCKSCLTEFWKKKGSQECPVCRRKSSKTEPPSNRALSQLCTSLQERACRDSAGPVALCNQHNEKLQLFCLVDKQTICLVCQTSKTHRSHDFIPINEAAQDQKKELQTALVPLKKKLQICHEIKQTCDQTADHIKSQLREVETEITKEFQRLHQFLHNEEAARIAALREEEEQKSQMMKKKIEEMNRKISSLSDTIRAITEELRADDVSFLQNFEATMKRAKYTMPDSQLVSGALIDVAKHLGNMAFRVWGKMQEIVKHTPVILDPNTAHACLFLSADLTSVKCSQQRQKLPENPERCLYYADVLGSEGFSTGTHSWEVDVGKHPYWFLGVVNMSTDRKDEVNRTPKSGIWEIGQMNDEYTAAGESISLKKRPQRIRVQLDYDRGEVSFYDSKNMILICKLKDTFTERLYPFLSVGMAGDNCDLQICQAEVSFKLV
ncbi:hypothetical protein UPYG_G00232870 [Umbra pygmaea]|uniref:Uncharacterized protein n=1 Tax=Umbra pygmaea TaxID=75934 RepID=A0ABD0WIN5_UMBPY